MQLGLSTNYLNHEMTFWNTILIACVLIASTFGTVVEQCPGGTPKIDPADVSLTKCNNPPCILKRRTTVGIELKLRPDKDIKHLTTSVQGIIADLPLPFIGVDGTSACDNVYSEDGSTKVGCPLKAGGTYLYKNSFPVLQIYPAVSLKVHWALQGPNQRDVICFEVPARIK
ncbi:ecdysteroid-regulated 16 kDa protein isoform X2 [Hermetia illucens]|uniref:ecdysteroid-regulated 16 kDa protein isoform X2 n=1 Tax=Hermetia illucens TaxID=343691 RepID=UPI0018CC6875|nr:ecdysteroid-regulated 16 kDa protein isoform X2 [Hermetia illucens]